MTVVAHELALRGRWPAKTPDRDYSCGRLSKSGSESTHAGEKLPAVRAKLLIGQETHLTFFGQFESEDAGDRLRDHEFFAGVDDHTAWIVSLHSRPAITVPGISLRTMT